ncbi:MAG: thioredoxin-disulfide reductase [Syntrophobacterales bacterium]|nr:MAG: thioredoxin-disulfide reductase [Syntrophobacterales bacterium]
MSRTLTKSEKNRGGEIYDVVIVGGGPAGLTAGLYASRARLNTLLLEGISVGGQMMTTDIVENYPGFPQGISGADLTAIMEEHAKRFGLMTEMGEVIGLELTSGEKLVKTVDREYRAEAIIICTGTEYRKLGIPGEAKFTGRGVSYCATCDGAFFKDNKIVVVGGGDSALTEALFLTKFAKEITIIHRRDALRATKIYQERAFSNPKINFLWNSVVEEIKGNQTVESILVKNVTSGEVSEVPTEGVFMFVGIEPKTAFLRGVVELDESGYILVDENNLQTSVDGIFAAGDARKKMLRQVATAVGDGATAAFAVEKYLEERENT